jgi:dihydrofolate reductase
MAMSLDGFVTGPQDDAENPAGIGGMRLMDWLGGGGGADEGDRVEAYRPTDPRSRIVYDEMLSTGAVITGRRTGDFAGYWGGDHHDGVPIFVYSRQAPGIDIASWPLVTYVSDVGTAMSRARDAAGDKDVLVHGVATAQLALAAGVLDELALHVVPILLGGGRRLLDHLGPMTLTRTRVLEGEGGVTHLRYRVERAH